jgi:membrane-anchored glycerophosphoryl diester phosphodiesterase (GDPDase)
MSQHNIACFRIYFRKNTTDFISTSSRMIWLYFLPLTQVFHINFRVFAPFISWEASSLKSDKSTSPIWMISSRVLNQPYQLENYRPRE